jgi:hypothetical protein
MTRSRCRRSASKIAAAPGTDRPPNQAAANQARTMLGYAELPSGMILNGRKPMRGPSGKHLSAWLTVRWHLIGSIR